MKKKFSIKLLIILIIGIFIMSVSNIAKGETSKIELSLDEAYNECVMIIRYIIASKTGVIGKIRPEWCELTDEQEKKLDKNNNGKIDNNDLRRIKRHIEVMNNPDTRNKHPNWIIYVDNDNTVKNIVLSETSGVLAVGETKTITAKTNPLRVSEQEIIWASSNEKVAIVVGGKITAISNGKATIIATYSKDQTITAKYQLEVRTEPTGIQLSKKSINLDVSKQNFSNTETLTATITPAASNVNNKVEWSIKQNNGVISIDQNGCITALKTGKATVVAECGKLKAECEINVITSPTGITLDQTNLTVDYNKTNKVTLKATVQPLNVDQNLSKVDWISSDENIATVNNVGIVTLKKQGKVIITAKTSNGKTASCEIIVKQDYSAVKEIKLNKDNMMMRYNKSAQLVATVYPENLDNELKKVSWTSSNNNIATVDSNGKVTAKAGGIVTITAQAINGSKASCKVAIYKVDSRGYKIFYNSNGKMLDGRTNYNISDASKKENEEAIYSGTNEIIKTIGYENKYDYRIVINMDKNYKKCTLTVLAKDENNKYTIPVRSSLCTVAAYAKTGGYKSSYKLSKNRWNKWRAIGGWYGGGYGPSNGSVYSVPGAVSYPPGFLHSMGYSKSKPHKINTGNYAQMGGAYSAGCIRLYWQDLKWIYENCPGGTKIIMNRSKSTKELAPFGACKKLNRFSNKTQEKFKYTLTKKYEKNSKTVTCTINSATY